MLRARGPLTRILLVLALGAGATPSLAQDAEPGSHAWIPLASHVLAEQRAGLRIGNLDVHLDVWVRDVVDGRELPSLGFSLDDLEVAGEALRALSVPLVNRADGVRLQRDTQIRVRVEGFQSAFGSPALRNARARLRRAFE